VKLLVCDLFTSRKIEIGEDEIHHQASRPPGRVAMPLQQVANSNYVVNGFQRIEVIRMLPQPNPAGAKPIVTFAIAHTNPAPVVALDQNQGSGKR